MIKVYELIFRFCPMCYGSVEEIEVTPETNAAVYQYRCESCGHEFD